MKVCHNQAARQSSKRLQTTQTRTKTSQNQLKPTYLAEATRQAKIRKWQEQPAKLRFKVHPAVAAAYSAAKLLPHTTLEYYMVHTHVLRCIVNQMRHETALAPIVQRDP